jgi:hypothetical protein
VYASEYNPGEDLAGSWVRAREAGSGATAFGFPVVGRMLIDPVVPTIRAGLSLFLLSPLFLFFALFATVAHGRLSFLV